MGWETVFGGNYRLDPHQIGHKIPQKCIKRTRTLLQSEVSLIASLSIKVKIYETMYENKKFLFDISNGL
jgi:hypothetical protein